jgi:hypothetical protein
MQYTLGFVINHKKAIHGKVQPKQAAPMRTRPFSIPKHFKRIPKTQIQNKGRGSTGSRRGKTFSGLDRSGPWRGHAISAARIRRSVCGKAPREKKTQKLFKRHQTVTDSVYNRENRPRQTQWCMEFQQRENEARGEA